MNINDIKNSLTQVERTINEASGKMHLAGQLLVRTEADRMIDTGIVSITNDDFEALQNMIADAKTILKSLEF